MSRLPDIFVEGSQSKKRKPQVLSNQNRSSLSFKRTLTICPTQQCSALPGETFRGRFGCSPELLTLNTDRSWFQDTLCNTPRSTQISTSSSFSMSSGQLNHYGIVLSGYFKQDLSLVSTTILDRFGDWNTVGFEDSNEDPSQYFRDLKETVISILEAEKKKNEEKIQKDLPEALCEISCEGLPCTVNSKTLAETKGPCSTTTKNNDTPERTLSVECRDLQGDNRKHETVGRLSQSNPSALDISPLCPPSHVHHNDDIEAKKEMLISGRNLPVNSVTSCLSNSEESRFDTKLFIRSKIQLYDNLMKYLTTEFQSLKNDSNLQIKQFRISTRKAITLTINQLASTSVQIDTVSSRLSESLMSLHKATSKRKLDERFYRYALVTTVEVILNNVEVQVVSNPRSVWGYSRLVLRLCSCPDFKICFEAMALTRCPYIIPYMEAFWINPSLSEGSVHGQPDLTPQRMECWASILRLWLAFLIVSHDIGCTWSWYARFLNTGDPPIVSPRLLSAALEVSAFALYEAYPIQFKKILMSSILLHTLPLYKRMKSVDKSGIVSAAITQIEIFLDDFTRTNTIPVSEGYSLKYESHKCS